MVGIFLSIKVEKCVTQLELILKGDVVGAKELDSESPPSRSSDSGDHTGSKYAGAEHLKQQKWTSFEFTEAMSVLKNFMKLRSKGCLSCNARNPKITKPTFGWLHMVYLFTSFVLEN